MKLLLHACCGPCACYPTEKLAGEGTDFDILFFNPNIHPYKEFKHRLSTLREFCEKKQYNLIINKSYPIEECIRGMLAEPTVRCAFCYRMRLRYVAQFAKENGYDAFSTTLLVSPYQKHELSKKEAQAAAEEFGVPCLVSMEERMGCGVGACLVCACDMADGSRKHVCKDGPVFDAKEVDWNV